MSKDRNRKKKKKRDTTFPLRQQIRAKSPGHETEKGVQRGKG